MKKHFSLAEHFFGASHKEKRLPKIAKLFQEEQSRQPPAKLLQNRRRTPTFDMSNVPKGPTDRKPKLSLMRRSTNFSTEEFLSKFSEAALKKLTVADLIGTDDDGHQKQKEGG